MSKEFGLRCKIHDWHGIHNGYMLTLRPGYTALVGPNGAGKTTLLQQLSDIGKKRGYDVFFYSNVSDGGDMQMQVGILTGNFNMFASAAMASEGQRITQNFSNVVKRLGQAVKKAVETDTPLLILLDALDSGASIDRLHDLKEFLRHVERDAGIMPGGAKHEVYIVVAANNYELVRMAPCVDVRTGKAVTFVDYGDYARWICRYFDNDGKEGKH